MAYDRREVRLSRASGCDSPLVHYLPIQYNNIMTGNRLFTDEQVNDILLGIDTDELCESRTLKVSDDVMVKLYFGNVGFDAICYQWGVDEYGDNDWLEASRVLVWGTGDFEDDLLYGLQLVLQRATDQVCS